MLSVAEAQRKILSFFTVVDTESLPLSLAAGRVLAFPVVAQVNLPRFANSAMDGFAVRMDDVRLASVEEPVILQVVGDIPAGSTAQRDINPGEAIRIMTGAPLPFSAEAVIPVENTDFHDRLPGAPLPDRVRIYHNGPHGANIRVAGSDVQMGDRVLQHGRKLRPQDIGLLSMLGITQVTVHRAPRVAILSTGDELIAPGETLVPGKIHDSNSNMLAGLVQQTGGVSIDLGIAQDREDAVEACLERAVEWRADLIISTAGVSVGAFDFVRKVVEKNGALAFWKVNIRPGKPFTFGHYRSIPFFGLPGNPVSAFVSFEVFVRPAICKMLGMNAQRLKLKVRVTEPIESDGRETYLRAIIDYSDGPFARLTGHQGSGNLRSLVEANALLIIPSEVKSVPAGTELDAWLLES